MLRVYKLQNGQVTDGPLGASEPLPPGAFWIDLFEPTEAEEAHIELLLGIDLPTQEEMREIEPSSRLYREGSALFMTASVLNQADTHEPETRAVTFILIDTVMVTVRFAEPVPFRTYPARITAQPELCKAPDMALVNLLDAIVDRIADMLETVDATVGGLPKTIFAPLDDLKMPRPDYSEELRTIGVNAFRCSRVDESLVTLSRLLTFLDAHIRDQGRKDVRARIKDLQRDILSLSGYVERLSEKLDLMLNATLGMINIQQTGIIKIFSVLAVVLLPPTLIASIYGMNFEAMPELRWPFGYPLALLMMLISSILPYMLFKRKGWL